MNYQILVITPVKNGLENTLQTISSVLSSDIALKYIIYDDFSDPEVSDRLKNESKNKGFDYIHLSELTSTPSPNYLYVLKDARQKAIESGVPLIVVESDVEVKKDTFSKLLSHNHENVGMIGAVTVDNDGEVNFPYLKFKGRKKEPIETKRSLSFCCTLMDVKFLKAFDFETLSSEKDWFDTTISKGSIDSGFVNYVLLDTPVLHKPHGSRPWKQLKYSNPLKYYWLKFTKGLDKI
jgi:hypothetical protein